MPYLTSPLVRLTSLPPRLAIQRLNNQASLMGGLGLSIILTTDMNFS
jgi:hypothetical protein